MCLKTGPEPVTKLKYLHDRKSILQSPVRKHKESSYVTLASVQKWIPVEQNYEKNIFDGSFP